MARSSLEEWPPSQIERPSIKASLLPWSEGDEPESRVGKSREESPRQRPTKPQQRQAFDIWLERGLRQMFNDVVNEPVPEELLKLIQDDREKQG